MSINFSKLSFSPNETSLEPRDLFMSLPNKDSRYGYPRDVQTEVWKQWFSQRDKRNTIIKMNTGSGKTVVGLTILQSCLNEGKGPAVYIVPDNYLVSQVCVEAQKLGIKVASDKFDETGTCVERGEEDYFFMNKKAILVANIHKLVNGKSIFGLRRNGNIPIGSVIVDDVHACMDTIEQQYTVKINSEHPLYNQIVLRLSKYQEIKDSQTFYNITENQDQHSSKLIPFWIWQDCCEDIRRLLLQPQFNEDSIVMFNFPLLVDNWRTCNCVISTHNIEITPKSIPISKIVNFNQAERRIFMSATLADDSIFISAMGLGKQDVLNIITPEKANDIGERLFLFPKHLNAKIDDNNVKQQLITFAQTYNVVVIVPSFSRVKFWSDASEKVPTQILSSYTKNIESGINDIKEGVFRGLTILVNKYDGIDLPDEACRFLVIDGLPIMRNEYDIIVQSINPSDKRICRESIQKIEQGMGRGVRSNNDYCVVVLMGDKLADVIINQGGEKFFSKATYEQYNLSKQLWEQLMNGGNRPSITEVFQLANYVLTRNTEWICANRGALASIEYDKVAIVDNTIVAMRQAFDKEGIGRYDEAFSIIESEKNQNTTLDEKSKGFLMQLMAEYKNFSSPTQAQEILLSAQKLNSAVLRPIKGIQYEKLQSFSEGQGINVLKYIADNKFSANNYLIHVGSILDDLIFTEDSFNSFEDAIQKVASIIGIHSSRPEKEGIKGSPDNLWAIGNLEYFVIECKNGVKSNTTTISKSDCSQLLSSIQWFENLYEGNEFKCYPIIIHRVSIFDSSASPDPRTRIMTEELLNRFKTSVKSFAENVAQGDDLCTNATEIQKLLNYYKLNGQAIINEYTVPVRI